MKGILDMISIVGDVDSEMLEKFVNSCGFTMDPNVRYEMFVGWKSYKHNWYVSNNEKGYSYFIGYCLNSGEDLSKRLMIEFNPSKVDYVNDKYLKELLRMVVSDLDNFKVGYADIAFDFEGVSTDDLIIDKARKRNYREFYYPKTNKTIYIGNPKTNGSIKIYDKARELKENPLKEKTRYEVTLKVSLELSRLASYKFKGSLPICYVKDDVSVYNLDIKPGDKLLLYSVNNGFDVNQLTYEQRKKFENLNEKYNKLKEIKKIELTPSDVEEALISSVIDILNNVF